MPYKIDTEYFGSMPNQAEGDLNGKRFYFRARWGGWSLRVADTDHDAVTGEIVESGADENAGWWTETESKKFLVDLLEKHSK